MDNVPYFEHAPVVERVLGVQFQPVAGFHTGLLGAFWKALGEEWPCVNDANAIEPQYVDFEDDYVWPTPRISLRLMQTPTCRLQILNRQGDRMIQLQNGRFHLNWKGSAGPDYPRYPQIRDEFDRYFNCLSKFLRNEAGTPPVVDLWEVTYLNHLPKATVWNNPADWTALFPTLVQPSAIPGPLPLEEHAGFSLETFGGAWQYEISPRKGKLHVELRHGRHERADAGELLVFTLTARGVLEGGTATEIHRGLDLGRYAIGHAFKTLTSKEAHAYWGLKDEAA